MGWVWKDKRVPLIRVKTNELKVALIHNSLLFHLDIEDALQRDVHMAPKYKNC